MTGTFQPRNTRRARALRNQATPAERLLWRALSNSKVNGHKFSRQMPVGPYFADFLCRSAGLVIEIDGWSHDVRVEHDRRRDAYMASQGLKLLRFTNGDVLDNLEGVVQTIALALVETRGSGISQSPSRLREGLGVGLSDNAASAHPHPQPLPQAGGE